VPELPEAETIVRSLRGKIVGRRVVGEAYPGKRVWRTQLVPTLRGRAIAGVERYGKQVLIVFDTGHLLVRLGMTGALLVDGREGDYTRAILELDGVVLLFDDVRQFGWFESFAERPNHLGPDPLEITAREFTGLLLRRNTQIKRALLDQSVLRGMGNIYTDEALFRAGLHPEMPAARLKHAQAEALHGHIVELLTEAIAARGSSISDYVDADGERGSFQTRHRVYGKEGQPCPNCGRAIERIVIAQRGTHYCPACQKAPRKSGAAEG
jgi:formamidopyrimidine-DNA glycosylase